MKKICVIGSYSGRNAGDAAILENLLHDISSVNNNVEFLVPTISKSFIDSTYSRFPVKSRADDALEFEPKNIWTAGIQSCPAI